MKKATSAFNQKGNRTASTLRRQIKDEWRALWNHKISDKIAAEDIARRNYELLFIEKGTVIKASKDYQPPDIFDVLHKNEKLFGVKLSSPDPKVGGWRKFSKDILSNQPRWHKKITRTERHKKNAYHKRLNPKKNGKRGWLHLV